MRHRSKPFSVNPVRGVFASAGATDSDVVGNSNVRGVLVRVFWRDLEPNPGQYNWSLIDNQISLTKSLGKKWSLAVLGGSFAPSWLYSPPFSIGSMSLTFQGGPVTVPKFWDNGLQTRLNSLAQALSARYLIDDSLALVYLPQMTLNGVEGHFNGIADATLTGYGMTESNWANAVLSAANAFAAAFPPKPIAVELHNILSSHNAPQQIMNGISSGINADQIGVAVWWLSGKTTYQTNLLTAIGNFNGEVYTQLIDNSADVASFQNNDYTTAFTQAQSLGSRYIEPWDVDVELGTWNSLFSSFNTFSDS